VINDCEFLEGAAFIRLVNYGYRVAIAPVSSIHSSIYLIETENHQSAVLFKHSKKPKSSWSFTLSSQEEEAFTVIHSKYPESLVFIAFICHRDGICCVSEKRLMSVIDTETGIAGQHISVSRKPRGSYYVSGPGRQKMVQTVSQSDWPRVIIPELNTKL
jgi:hypothetical protein